MRVLFLYTEIAEYFIACCKELLKNNCEIHIVRFPVNKEAPFQFNIPEEINIYLRSEYNNEQLLSLVNKIHPQIIVCSGWIDKGYLNICKLYKKKTLTILTLDNHWTGSLKQRLACLLSPFYILNTFSKCWVPGMPQTNYAKRLGFKKENILTGFYSCDQSVFFNYYLKFSMYKSELLPKRFIYVGRYYEFKGIKDLWNAFIQLQDEHPNDWELWCLGTGDIEPIKHEKIKHYGFIQPNDMEYFIKETGVFVLPSHFEPWGVVVHEFAAAGFPLICSDKVGAASQFLKNGINGYTFKAGDVEQLKLVLLKIIQSDKNNLENMGRESSELSIQITPEIWAKTLINN